MTLVHIEVDEDPYFIQGRDNGDTSHTQEATPFAARYDSLTMLKIDDRQKDKEAAQEKAQKSHGKGQRGCGTMIKIDEV